MASMAEPSRNGVLQDFYRASRKAEEAALRRYQAVHWLEHFVGPLGIPREPSEKEFISCLRNGIILCNVINKINPGSVPKVVENHLPIQSESISWDSPLPAYQYFENVRNFLVAVKGLNLPAFEASDLENIEAGSAVRIADCILALKSYHEWKEWSGGNGVYKHVTAKSPMIMHSAAKHFTRPLSVATPPQPCRRLDMSALHDKQALQDSLVKALTEHMVGSKENMNYNFLTSAQNGNQDPVHIFNDILSRCLEEKLRNKIPALNSCIQGASREASGSRSILKENLSMQNNIEGFRAQSRKDRRKHLRVLQCQERDLLDIKALWYQTKRDFKDLQSQLFDDLNHLGSLVKDMSAPALGYQKVVQENRKLYNMVQDLKGNIRVYCRIKPILNARTKNVIDFIGEDGSLVVVDPSNPKCDGRKAFQFNQVYSPTAAQGELFKDAQPLIRSVMDGYSGCILAYGQAGSGKTYTMYGSSDASEKETGIVSFALNDIFDIANERKAIVSYEVHLQMGEICNEEVRDLLDKDPAFCGQSSPEMSLHSVKSAVDAMNLLKCSRTKCAIGNSTAMNNHSSRSHRVMIVHVHGKDASGNNLHGRLHFVDLAGTGEVHNSEDSGDGLANQLADKSLSCLEDVLTSLSQKNSHIPYRSCKLTSMLQDALGAHTKILMFAHVSPEVDHFAETLGTLKFAQRVSTIELGAAHSSKKNSEAMELQQEIEALKSQLAEKDPRSPLLNNKQPRSPREKPSAATERTPLVSRRLSLENGGSIKTDKRLKSPLKRPKPTESTPQKSLRSSIETPISRKTNKVTDAGVSKSSVLEGSVPRARRLSLENPMMARSEKAQRVKDPKSPNGGRKGLSRPTPQRTRRLSIETPIPMNCDVQFISVVEDSKGPQASACLNQPAFTDCAAKFPSIPPPKTPEHHKLVPHNEVQTVMYSGMEIPVDLQTPATAKTTNGKGSHFKRSLRTIGKLINGSEKRNQQKMESLSVTGKSAANEAKSPPTSKGRALRRQSLTGIPPPGPDRRSSLGGTPTDARPTDNRNAKTPPPIRSSTKITKRWM